ncbi:hypothetical protein [uncultured Methanolobus sp.]|nr:hypothetical protein [uncultured Methanolobus sp.]
MEAGLSILSLLSNLIEDDEQVNVLKLISEGYFNEELLEQLLDTIGE